MAKRPLDKPHELDIPDALKATGTPAERIAARAKWLEDPDNAKWFANLTKHSAEQRVADQQIESDYLRREVQVVKQVKTTSPDLDAAPIPGADKPKPKRESKVMATKTKKRKTVETEGYSGHRAGSRIGEMHRIFDEKGEDAARAWGTKQGLSPTTLSIQCGNFRKEAGIESPRKAKGKAKPKAKAKGKTAKSKGKAKAKTPREDRVAA